MESIVKDDIMAHLKRNKLIKSSQHGFMRGKSTTTNLLEFLDKLSEATDKGIDTDVVYLDFAKAFDKVPRERQCCEKWQLMALWGRWEIGSESG